METKRAVVGTILRGGWAPVGLTVICACFLGVTSAAADPTTTIPDPASRANPPVVAPAGFRPSWDLDGVYLWLGPTVAASRIEGEWDSIVGGDLSVLRVREHETLATIGGSAGAAVWTERGGGRIWADMVVGTRIGGWMVGTTAGPLVELSDVSHPRVGGSVGVFGFVGVTPFARVGYVDKLGGFAEIGVHLALPVLRR